MPFAAVFNNLVTFDPAKVHESIETVIPDLAESWAWDQTNTRLTFKLADTVISTNESYGEIAIARGKTVDR